MHLIQMMELWELQSITGYVAIYWTASPSAYGERSYRDMGMRNLRTLQGGAFSQVWFKQPLQIEAEEGKC